MAREVDLPDVDVIEMNISCPTRDPGGGNFALHEDHTYEIVRRVRARNQEAAVGEALAQCRRDRPGRGGRRERPAPTRSPSPTRSWASRSIPRRSGPPSATATAGCPGPASSRSSLRMVHQCSKAVKIPIIGCGGIVKVEDVVEYMLAGASAVMIGYLIFRNPSGHDRHHRGARGVVRQARLCPRRRPHRRDDRRSAARRPTPPRRRRSVDAAASRRTRERSAVSAAKADDPVITEMEFGAMSTEPASACTRCPLSRA